MGNKSANTFRFSCDSSSEPNVMSVLDRQVPVVLRIKHVQKFRGVCLHHHLCWISLSRLHSVDNLMLGAVGHGSIPNVKLKVLDETTHLYDDVLTIERCFVVLVNHCFCRNRAVAW